MQEALREREAGAEAPLRVAYGEGEHHFGELSLPPGPGPFPLAVVVHGGCWLSIAGVDYMRPFARALVEEGWAVWSLEFRRIDQEGGAWPGILQDVAAGADHARALARAHPLDLSRVVTVGHSSGGHLALWLAGREALPADEATGARLRGTDPLPVAAAVGLAAIADLEDYRNYTRCGPTAVEDFLGVGFGEAGERLAVSDPAVMATSAPRLVIMGELDPIVPPAHGQAFRERAAAGGVEVAVVPGAGHFELVAPWTASWSRVAERVRAFLDALETGR